MLSIIVPYKNASPWIRRCCESLHNIVYDEFEFIMVNDNDNFVDEQIIRNYVEIETIDERFRMLDNERWPGVSGARNTGIDRARGDFITFLDADDELTDNAGRSYLATLRADANIHQLNHKRYYEKTKRLVTKYTNVGGWYDINNRPNRWEFTWNKIYRREFLNDNGIRFAENLSYGEDELFNLRCLAADNRIHHADVSLTAVIHHFENKQSLSKVKTAGDLLDHIRSLEDFIILQDDPTIRGAVCDIISEHWKSKSFKKLLGLQE